MRFFTVNRDNAELSKTRRFALIVANAAILDIKQEVREDVFSGRNERVENIGKIVQIDLLETQIRSKKVEREEIFKTRFRMITEIVLGLELIAFGFTVARLGQYMLASATMFIGGTLVLIQQAERKHLKNKFSRLIREIGELQKEIMKLDSALTEYRVFQLFRSFNNRAGASEEKRGVLSNDAPTSQ